MALSAAALAMVGLTACGGGKTTPTSDAPTAVATAAPVSNPAASAAVLPGTRYYLEKTSNNYRIHAVRGSSDVVVHELPFVTYGCEANTLTVSPDGKRVAWVQDSTDGNVSGVLMAGTIGKPGATRLLDDVSCLDSRALVWQGGDLLMVHKKTRESVLFDVAANKRVDGDPGQETDRCWSVDGRWLAAMDDRHKPYVTDGTQSRHYSYTPRKEEAAHWGGWRAQSVSMDGRYVSVGWDGTDPSRRDDSFAVVDTTTSKVVDLPGGGEIRSIMFTADDKVIVKRATGISVLDSSFTPLGTVEEPAALRNMTLLAYAA
ncbi:hypothetical protein Q2K19_11040 [Micromonospora soli]|uniref:hypothetical protein n=1 Tax=Micromonospora sp. NBRC 110009 TaxID=3061627 RepID=UPI002673C34F|nr:hypothetical protein [Micromonospora sp. NBRC 110009]WKU00970.1 hypothetical protein Q2K19_11040 [Micromonospora sp. NBRC 110009]